MRLRLLAAVFLAVFVIAACAIAAQPGGRAALMAGRRAHVVRVCKQLGLSDAQKADIKAIRTDARASAKAIRADTSLAPDARRAQLKQLRRQTMGKIKALLTPEQLRKLDQLKAARHAKRGLPPA